MRKMLLLGLILSTILLSIGLSKTRCEVQAQPLFVPEWAKNVVWYEITPETFRNSDSKNDPTWEMQNHYFPDLPKTWQIHPWGADWYAMAEYERKNGKGFVYNFYRRRYGGDLQGVIDKLDYLRELGIGAIYMMPLFYSYSYHKYDGVCFHHIDPYFGPDPEGDKALINKETPDDPKTWVWTQADRLAVKMIEEAHRRNIRIIFDGPFNHLGVDSFAFRDVVKNQEKSRFANWFTIYNWANPKKKTPLKWKPFMNETIYAELRKDEEAPNNYIMASTQRWMKPVFDGQAHEGLDGWRLDVADFIPHAFWKDWCKLVRSINPDAYIMGEITKPFIPYQTYLNSEEFCSMMNYPFMTLVGNYFISKRMNAAQFDKGLSQQRNSLPQDVSHVLYNLLDSHDTERVASFIVNPGAYKNGDARDFGEPSLSGFTPDFDTRKPALAEYETLKLITIFQMTYIGAPAIFYGDEVGMWAAARNHKPMLWDDIQYANEQYVPDSKAKGTGNRKVKDDRVEINKDLFRHYQKLIQIRNANPALRLGDFRTILADDEKKLFAYSRAYENDSMIIILNNGNASQTVDIDATGNFKDLLNVGTQFQSKDGKINVEIPGKWGVILKKQL